MPLEHNHVDDSEYITSPTAPEEGTPTENPTESLDDINQDITDTEKNGNEYERDEYDVINTKEDIKYLMDKSKNSQELYENAIKVLTNLEFNFDNTLRTIAHEENWNWDKQSWINRSVFDDELDMDNPVTIFEKKGKELLQKAKTIQENLKVQNAASQTVGETNLSGISENEKNQLIEEVFKTREEAIQDFKDDVSDGFLSNENNISREKFREAGEIMGGDLFKLKEENIKEFEETISKMGVPQLAFSTFNIEQGSGAFTYCYGKLKERLGNKNLFDFIDEQEKSGDLIGYGIKYSAFKMLFQRRMTSDLTEMMDGYNGNKEELVKYVESNIKENEKFKMAFLTSIKDIESSKYFGDIAKDLKENDPDVKKAYEATSNLDNIDIFKDKKVNGLMLYDDEGHGGGATYFDSDFKDYQRKGFSMVSKEENKNYKKYVLKKGNDTIDLIKLKVDGNKDLDLKEVLQSITDGQDYNLFALRGHCYNTGDFAETLGEIGAVGEGDLLIDGGCNNAGRTRDYYNSGVKGQICAYTSTGKGASTQAFIDRIINAKNSGKSFSDVLGYYNGLTTDSGRDGYFAFSTERPDSVGAQYKKLTKRENEELRDIPNNLTQDLGNPVGGELEAHAYINPEENTEQNQTDEL